MTAPTTPAAYWFAAGVRHLLMDVRLGTDNIKAAIYTVKPDQLGDEFRSDLPGEATGTNYTPGGKTVTGITVVIDTTTDPTKVIVEVQVDPVTWAASTVAGQYLVFYVNTGSSASSAVLFYMDAGQVITSTNDLWSMTDDPTGVWIVRTPRAA